jgi:glycosyltransferase involved in cell wall biosynthesis
VLQIAMVSTYPPTQCGLATFTRSLAQGMLECGTESGVIRLASGHEPNPGRPVIHEHVPGVGLGRTVDVLNAHDAVIVQHEYGIYAGPDGDDVLNLMDGTTVPVIVVLHTVLAAPRLHQRYELQRIIDRADALVTMTETGRRNLLRGYDVDRSKVHVIPHGAADLRAHRADTAGARPSAGTRPSTVLTWGLLSEGKGIEWGIEALAMLAESTPSLKYLVAGQTHPKVLIEHGEQYRTRLIRLAEELGVASRVHFVNDYLDQQLLHGLIQKADIILLPYDSKDQVTSGVLTEAVVAGKPIISTRFPHAVELLSRGAGWLVEQGDAVGIAAGIHHLHSTPSAAEHMSKATSAMANDFLWSAIADRYLRLAGSLAGAGSGLRRDALATTSRR